MKDLPVFTTENGVASLTLREIPTQGCAYIKMQASEMPERLLADSVAFCRMVGAQKIYASGSDILVKYPLHTALWEMTCLREALGDTQACLWPVQAHTLDSFQKLYNQKISCIPNASWMTDAEGKRMLEAGEGYFIHKDGKLLGIGIVAGNELRFVASIVPGAGIDVVRALASIPSTETIKLQVASENKKAVQLYKRLGFVVTKEISLWYHVFG